MGRKQAGVDACQRIGKRLKGNHYRRFVFRLALNLGKTVKQLLNEIDSDELAEWYGRELFVEPLPDPYWIGAGIQAVIANHSMVKRKRPAKIEDFMPRYEQDREYDMNKEMAKMDAIMGRQNRKNINGKHRSD